MNTSNRISTLKMWLFSTPIALALTGCSSLSLPVFSNEQSEQVAAEQNARGSENLSKEDTLRENDSQDGLTGLQQEALALRQFTDRYRLTKLTLLAEHQAKFDDALLLYQQGNNEGAKVQIEALIEDLKASDTADVPSSIYVLRGDIAIQLAQLKDAALYYDLAREKNENNYLALNRLGVMAREEGQFTKAERLYLDAIDAWPGNPASYYNLGILYDLYMGKKKKALKNYEKYAALINNPLIGEVDKKASKEIARWIADLRRQLPAIDEESLYD